MRAAAILVLSAVLAGCAGPKPANIVLGEACWRCKRPIDVAALAGELVAPNGFGTKFRTVHCMATWIGQQTTEVDGHFWVTDQVSHKWVRADRAAFVRTVVNTRTMERDFLAFADRTAAAKAAAEFKSDVATWDDVLALGRAEPLGGD